MESIGSWKIQMLRAAVLLSLGAGCLNERWQRGYTPNDYGIRENDRTWEGAWNSNEKANRERDRDTGQNFVGYSQEHLRDTN
jgi:hypothetical protein